MGELVGFVIAWQMILENVVGAAAVARACSGYIDSLLGDSIKGAVVGVLGRFHSAWLGDFPDLLAFLIVIGTCALVCLGVKHSGWRPLLLCLLFLAVLHCVPYSSNQQCVGARQSRCDWLHFRWVQWISVKTYYDSVPIRGVAGLGGGGVSKFQICPSPSQPTGANIRSYTSC